jgi:mono/diheme cytochrome c family protein
MRISGLQSALLFAGLSLMACGQERGADQWPISHRELASKPGVSSAVGGETTYQQYCMGCHGADGRGNGGKTGADFTAATSPLRTRSDADLIGSVRDGKRGAGATMPAHSPILSDAQIGEVVGYVRARFQDAAPAN